MLLPVFLILFIASVAAGSLGGKVPFSVPVLYLACSIVTFAFYASDKSAARNGRWRTPERTLHFLALLGGWPGAVVAQRLLHHKSQKRPFQIIFLLTVAANCAALIWFACSRTA